MYQRHPLNGGTAADPATCVPLVRFINARRTALRDAARLLAGARGSRLVDDIADSLSFGAVPNPVTWGKLRDLLGILTLEHVHDDIRAEAAFFAAIDPCNPVVEEVCLLTDQLRAVLEQATAAPDARAVSLSSAA
ncbi:hypothetical protein ACR03S_02445 [Limimaricola variabilis]